MIQTATGQNHADPLGELRDTIRELRLFLEYPPPEFARYLTQLETDRNSLIARQQEIAATIGLVNLVKGETCLIPRTS